MRRGGGEAFVRNRVQLVTPASVSGVVSLGDRPPEDRYPTRDQNDWLQLQ